MQKSLLNPYISFKDNAREAMEFYQSVFGGKLDVSLFKDTPMPNMDPADGEKVMHAMLVADNGITLMGADTPNHMEYEAGSRISISLSGDNEEELRGYWDKLAARGKAVMPLEKAPWGDTFGMLVDQYGIQWMVNIAGPKPQE